MIVDLYAGGPSGWSTALALLGEKAIGLEYDARACATRAAIGHLTLRCDIGSYPLAPFFGKVSGITASPPCQTFSTSGKGEGRKHLDRLIAQVLDADWSTADLDDRTAHVLHTGRWVSTLMPEWVCFEQVRAVQPVWDAYAELLGGWGYSVWTGPLCAADYGTPQTRTRSILVASRVREVAKPVQTHAKGGEGGLASWVTMAEALGWHGASAMVGFPRLADTPGNEAGDNVVEIDGVAYRSRDLRSSDEPAMTVTEKARSWKVYPMLQPGSWADGRGGNRRLYEADEPAPALQFGHDSAGWRWVPGERPWPYERPRTTICGDPRVSPPGRHDPGKSGSQFGENPIRLQLWEALTLQDFDPALPIQGPRTAAFLQVGNAVPVRLALAALTAATGKEIPDAPDPDERGRLAGATPGAGPHAGLEAHVRAPLDRQGPEVDDRDERERLAGPDAVVGAPAAGDVRGAEVRERGGDPGAGSDDGVVGPGRPGGLLVAPIGSGRGGQGAAWAEALLELDGPSRDIYPVKGGPAPAADVVAAAASTDSPSFPKAARPVVHILTASSGTGGRRVVSVGCGAKDRSFEDTSSWSSGVTCPECCARIGVS